MKKILLISAFLVAGLALTGCDKKAGGQVAAVVNGEEITLQEINAEVGTTEIPAGVDKASIRQAALQRIIQRRLLAQSAKDDDLDQSAEFLLRRRALEDALLVQLLAKKVSGSIRVPGAQELDAFIAKRPYMFSQRSILTVDRIQFAAPSDPAKLAAFEADHSLDAIAQSLQSQEIPFSRQPAELDTAQLTTAVLQQIDALPAGEPFLLPQGGLITAGVVTARRPLPMLGDNAKPFAANALRNEQLSKAVEQRLNGAKAKAKIDYQSGFAPPKSPPAKVASLR